MKQQIQYYFFITVMALVLSSCATMTSPETNLERLSYLEISYGVILDKATLYANEGRLTDDQKTRLNTAFNAYEDARDLAKIAIDAADQGGFDNQTAAMTTILSALRSIVAEVEQ
jgi:hypothetical protein